MLDLDIPSFVFAVINLIVIYVILKKFLFVPVTNFMEKRKNDIIGSINDSKLKEENANELLEQYTKKLSSAVKDADELHEKAMEKSRIEYKNVIDQAKEEAEKIKEKAYLQIEKEKEEMIKDLRSQVSKLSILIASKLLKENMDTDRNKELVESFLIKEDILK